jgi:hypothetical protein
MAAALAGASDAPAGGIDDQPCPNVAGENTNTCPSGTIGTHYSIRFVEREGSGCGPGRQTFHLDSGNLPPGLSLELGGSLSGVPMQAGRFQFYVQMREPEDDPANCAGKRTEKQFTLVIRRPLSALPAAREPPISEVGVPLRMTLRARGGTGIFAWKLVQGPLPAGLRLRLDGSIIGIPRAAGTFTFVVRARDTEARTATALESMTVAPRLRVRTLRLPTARRGRAYSARLSAEGGVGRKAWRLDGGRLPSGLRLTRATGRLSGTPGEAGRFVVAFEVTDGLGVSSRKAFLIEVGDRPRAPNRSPRAADARVRAPPP